MVGSLKKANMRGCEPLSTEKRYSV